MREEGRGEGRKGGREGGREREEEREEEREGACCLVVTFAVSFVTYSLIASRAIFSFTSSSCFSISSFQIRLLSSTDLLDSGLSLSANCVFII